MKSIVLIVHDIRSCHNVGSLLRTAEGLGVSMVYFTGYTPYPLVPNDKRLPHISAKLHAQISKTALGAEQTQAWQYSPSIETVLDDLKSQDYTIAALEQTPSAIQLVTYQAPENIALILGREVEGIDPKILELTDVTLEIPMIGKKESFNVVQAAAMALYQLRFT